MDSELAASKIGSGVNNVSISANRSYLFDLPSNKDVEGHSSVWPAKQ